MSTVSHKRDVFGYPAVKIQTDPVRRNPIVAGDKSPIDTPLLQSQSMYWSFVNFTEDCWRNIRLYSLATWTLLAWQR
jgi:hypothetical protein